MAITYLNGPHHSGKSSYLLEQVVTALHKGASVTCLLPSIEHVNFYKRSLLASLGALPPGRFFIGTFLAHARAILDARHRTFQIITSAEEWLQILLLLKAHNSSADITPGLVHWLQRLFNEWRETGLNATELQNICRTRSNPALDDFLKIYAELRSWCRQTASGSPAELTLQALEACQAEAGARRDLLIVDGFYEFNPLQVKLLQALIREHAEIYLANGFCASQPVYHYGQDFTAFFGNGRVLDFSNTTKNLFTACQQVLFSVSLPVDAAKLPRPLPWRNEWSDPQIKIIRCPTRRMEIETAARTIKCWVLDGLALTDIGIVYRSNALYRPLLELILPQFGIPIPTAPRLLATTEPAQLLLRSLRVNRNGLSRSDLLDLLRLPIMQQKYQLRTIQIFETISAGWGLPLGHADWLARCQAQLEYFQWHNAQIAADSDFQPISQLEIAQLQHLEAFLKSLFEDIVLPEKLTWPEFEDWAIRRLRQYAANETNQSNLELLLSTLRSLKKLLPANQVLTVAEIELLLHQLLNSVTTDEGKTETGVFIGDLMAARGKFFTGLIVLGLNEGEFPARHDQNPLFAEALRAQLNQSAGRTVFKLGDSFAEERYLFHLLIGRCRQRLQLSYPEMDTAGKELPPSPFILELLHAAKAAASNPEQVNYEFLAADQVFPPLAYCASLEDLALNFYSGGQIASAELQAQLPPELLTVTDYQLNIQKRRENDPSNEFSGNLSDERWLYPVHGDRISVTALQNYAKCPFFYLLANFWKIPIITEPTLEMDVLLRGTLVHQILEKIVSPYRNDPAAWRQFLENSQPSNWEPVLEETLTTMRRQLHFLYEMQWRRLRLNLIEGITQFIAAEKQALQFGFSPHRLEEMILIKGAPFTTVKNAPFQSFSLVGKADRIDLNPEHNQYFILDYKLSTSNVKKIIDGAREGTQFQIPLYLIMLPLSNAVFRNYAVGGVCYYSFKTGKREKGFYINGNGKNSITATDWQELTAIVTTKVNEYLQAIVSGNFPPLPAKSKNCTPNGCDYYDVCRYNSYRVLSSEEEGGESPDE